jgi:general secretion pathway protein H
VVTATHGGIRRQRAFTLVEMLVALALAALAAALVAPRINDSLALAKSRAAVRAVGDYLASARATAILRQDDTVVTIDADKAELSSTARDDRLILPPDSRLEIVVAAVEKVDERSGGIRFFPDGTATGGKVRVMAGKATGDVEVQWLTGRVSLSFEGRAR